MRQSSKRGQRTDGWGGKGRERGREGRALRLIDHFLSEWSGLESRERERRGIQFEDWDFDGEGICRGKGESVGE